MFKFKGISSKDMQVVIEEEEHFIARAARRYETTEIEGRDGAIFEELGYSYVERPIYVQCLNTDKIDEILAWLDGEGEFEYKGRKTTARFYSQLEPQREGYIRIIDTTFIRDPFWTKLDDEYIEVKGRKDKTTPKSSNINVKDSSDLNAKVDVYGISEQETREGYNKFDYDAIEGLAGSTTKTNINGLKVYKRTSIQQNIWPLFNLNDVLEDGKAYTMCFDVWADEQTTFNNQTLYVNSSIRVKHNLSNITTAKQRLIANFTYTKNDSNAIIHIYPTTSETNNFYIANVMLLEGTFTSENIPEFEQYGASPSPEFKSDIENVEGNVDITICNKNLFTGFVKGKGINSSTGEELQRDTSAVSDFINVDFNKVTNYYLSGLTDRLNSYIAAYSKDKKFLGRTNANPVNFFILNKDSFVQYKNEGNIAFIRITQYVIETSTGTINDIDNLKVQLEIGNTLTDYIENEQQTITFPLAQGQKLYKGDYPADDGIHHVRKQIELDGTENWIALGINYYLTINDKKTRYELIKGKMLCTHFKETTTGVTGEVEVGEFFEGYYSTGNRNVFFNYDNGESGVEGFKSYLSQQKQAGTPVILEYELEEEEIEPYTEEQQEAYNKLQNVLSYKTVTNVFTNQGLLEFKYIEDTTEKITNEGSVYSRPILRLEKTICNEVDIMIEDVRFQYDFNDEEYVEIDCEEKEAKYEGLNRNRKIQIGYEFPKLKAGENKIKMYGGDCIIKAKRKDRWL